MKKIDERLWEKFTEMNNALNDPWPTTLDYDGSVISTNKEEFKSDYDLLVQHLRELHSKNNDYQT